MQSVKLRLKLVWVLRRECASVCQANKAITERTLETDIVGARVRLLRAESTNGADTLNMNMQKAQFENSKFWASAHRHCWR